MRVARPVSTLVLTAHGSRDLRSAVNANAVADQVRQLRPGLDVRSAFLEHSMPSLIEVLNGLPDGHQVVVTPLLLTSAYHARIDIPKQVAHSGALGIRQAEVLGRDDRLVSVLRERLATLNVSPLDQDLGVLVVATGSSKAAVNDHTARVASRLAKDTEWSGAVMAFATGAEPSVAAAADQLRRRGAGRIVIAPWFLAPGRITDRVSAYAQRNNIRMAPTLGAHRLVAETVLDRYDQALAQRVAA
jgi:sirohydrochlorin ferrochelatase